MIIRTQPMEREAATNIIQYKKKSNMKMLFSM